MANEFKIKNGLIVDQGGANITGSTLISGNVGIGTTSLNNIVPLQINGSGISGIQSGIQFKNVGAGSGFFMSNPSAGNYADFEFWNYENGFFRFGTNNQEILRMTSGGDVGIKTTSPSARLHVKGSGTTDTTTSLRVENSAATPSLVVRDDNRVGIGTASPSVKLDIRNGAHGEIFYVIGNPSVSAAGAVYGTDPNVAYLTSAYSNSALGFGINGSYSEFFITATKNIAIGKYTANAKLDVSGSAIISGSFTVTGSSTFFGDVIPGGPYTSNTSSYSLGSATAAWKDLYVSNGSIFFITGSTSASIQLTNDQITFTGASVVLPTGSSSPTASYVNTLNQNVIISGSLITTGSTLITGSLVVTGSISSHIGGTDYFRVADTPFFSIPGVRVARTLYLDNSDSYVYSAGTLTFDGGSGVVNIPSSWTRIANLSTRATGIMNIIDPVTGALNGTLTTQPTSGSYGVFSWLGRVGIGVNTPSSPLHIKSANNTSGTYNTVWYNSSNTWLAGMRDDGLFALFAFKRIYMNDVHVGEYGTNNTVLGYYAGGTAGYNGGEQNTTVGHYALFAPGASAIQNTAIGYYAGHAITTGQGNVFVGRWAGVDNTTGGENMYLGNNAGQKNSVGSENVAIGTSALNAAQSSSYNVAIGNQAAALLTTGSYNTYVGRSAGANARNTNYNTTLGYGTLFGNHSGSENVAIGIYAGAYLTDGSTLNSQPTQSIYIGSYTSASSATEQNAIVIGHGASGLGSNTVVLGNDNILGTFLKGAVSMGGAPTTGTLNVSGSAIFDTDLLYVDSVNSKVGVGTSSPIERLHVEAIGDNTDVAVFVSGTGTKGGGSYLDFLKVENTGGGSTPKKFFRIDGTGQWEVINDAYSSVIMSLEDSGNMTIAGTLTQNSDASLKTNVQTIPNALEKTLQLRGVEYDRKDTNKHEIGLIAQEVEQVLPELVSESNGLKSVAYQNIVGLLIESIKELKQEINVLREQINQK